MRQEIAFNAEGVTLRGWLYLPDRAAGPVPTIVMAHGFSAVKEMYLDAFAEVFVQAGFGALVFDNRNFGASAGEPRQEIDPWQQVRDYRHAITYACTLPTVDTTRIGIWGSSYSGGHVLVVGAMDRRVRCVVAQVPLISGHRNARRLIRADFIAPVQAQFDQDRRRRFGKGPRERRFPHLHAGCTEALVRSRLGTLDEAACSIPLSCCLCSAIMRACYALSPPNQPKGLPPQRASV